MSTPLPTHATGTGSIPVLSILIPERLRDDTPAIRLKIENDLVPSIVEHGLGQPILLNHHDDTRSGVNILGQPISGNYSLIMGWSRLTSFSLLQYETIPYNERINLSEDEHYALELEENLRRNNMTWQETAKGIYRVHKLKLKNNALNGDKWGYRQTGALLNQSFGYVNEAVKYAELLLRGDEEIAKCETITQARQIVAQRKEDEIHRLLQQNRGQQQRQINQLITDLTPTNTTLPSGEYTLAPPSIEFVSSGSTIEHQPREYATVDLSCYHNGDSVHSVNGAEAVMDTFPKESFDLIYTDIPYGIDMDNLEEMVNIDRVEAAHDIDENVDQMPLFLRKAYRLLKDKSYLLFWMDIKHWEKLKAWGEEIGFGVQPYPLIWHKLHTCKNKAAHCHWTKNIEYVMVMRKGKATLASAQQSCVFACSGYEERKKQSNPFSKPFEFSKWLLDPILVPGMRVLDCYAGEGSGVRALLNLGADVTAIEKNPIHFPRLIEHVKNYYRELYQGYVNFIGEQVIGGETHQLDQGTEELHPAES